MTKRLAKYTVYIWEEANSQDNVDVIDALAALPGYDDHEWEEWVTV